MKIVTQPFHNFIGFVVVTLVCVNLIAALTNKWWMWNMKLFAKMVIVVLKRVLDTKRFSEPFTKQLTNVPPRTKNSFSHMFTISSIVQ